MNPRENTLEEQEKIEEQELLSSLHNLNTFYKEKDKHEFLNSLTYLSKNSSLNLFSYSNEKFSKMKRPFSFNSKDNLDFDFDVINKDRNLSNCSTNDSNFKTLILQNLEIFEDVIKIMVMGDKHIGKTFLISKLLSLGKNSHIPTQNLEIYNKIHEIYGKCVKLEFFDTCAKIMNDSLIKSILILLIKVYYKLSNGFILLCNNHDINSILFIEKQIERILSNSISDKNIMIICNEKKPKNDIPTYKV